MLKKFGREAKRIGKQAETLVKEASQDIKEVVDSTVIKIATSGQLKQAQDRANNVNERLEVLRGQLSQMRSQALELILDENTAAALNKEEIQQNIKTMDLLLGAIAKQAATVSSSRDQIEAKPNDGTSSKTAARDACENFLGKQKADEATFATLEKQLKSMIVEQVEAIMARQQSSNGVVTFSSAASAASDGTGSLQVQAPPAPPLTTDTTLGSNGLNLGA